MILITGAAGTIGSVISQRLREDCVPVLATDLVARPHVVRLDIRDLEAVSLAVNSCDTVIHLADVVGVDLVNLQSLSDFEELLQAHLHLIRACGESGKRLVLASSSEVYGSKVNGLMRESDPVFLPESTQRRHLYARSKLLMEAFANQCFEDRMKDLLTVRFFNVVGPLQNPEHGFVLPRFIDAALTNAPLLVFGDGQAVRYFCHVEDAVDSVITLMNLPERTYSLYNVGAENGYSMLELAELVKKVLHSESEIKLIPETRTSDVRFRRPDLSRLNSEIPRRKTKSMEQIILDVAGVGIWNWV